MFQLNDFFLFRCLKFLFYFPLSIPIILLMMLFSTGTRLGRVRIVGPELELPLGLMLRSPVKTSSKEDQRGLTRSISDA